MRKRLIALLPLFLLLMMLLPAPVLAGPSVSRPMLPKSRALGITSTLPFGTKPTMSPGIAGLAAKGTPSSMSLVSAQPEIPLEVEGFFYWSGDDLCVEGFAYNESSYLLNYPQIWYQVWSGDTKIAEGGLYASAHAIQPGGDASFSRIFNIPSLAGTDMEVYLYAFGYQDTLPYPVELTQIGRNVVTSGGLRTYTCVFRNDSDKTVHTPVLGGLEEDAEGYIVDMLDAREEVTLAPGETWTTQAVGHYPDGAPADVYTWAEALPVLTHNTVYRFRNLHNGFYLWTSDLYERNTIVRELKSTWLLEGPAYRTRISTNNAPLWRFCNIQGGFYLYTGDAAEKANIIATLGSTWKYEGPTFKVSMNRLGAPVWRFRNLQNGTYLYSADANEKNTIIATLGQTWLFEGPAYYLAP